MMNKIARAQEEPPANDTVKDAPHTETVDAVEMDKRRMFLKRQLEDEIRAKLVRFAEEMTRARKQRERH